MDITVKLLRVANEKINDAKIVLGNIPV